MLIHAPRLLTTALLFAIAFMPIGKLSWAADEAGLSAYKARYSIRKGGFKLADVNIQLQRNGKHYRFVSDSETTGLVSMFRSDTIHESSELEIENGRIIPKHYFYERVSKKPKKVDLEFDWQARKVKNTVAGKEWAIENLPDNTVDKFSIQLAAMLGVQTDNKSLTFHYAEKGKLKEYLFTVEGRERIDTKLGEYDTIKIKRVRAKKKKRITYSWLAPELGYVLVRMQHVEPDGATLDLVLEEFSRTEDK